MNNFFINKEMSCDNTTPITLNYQQDNNNQTMTPFITLSCDTWYADQQKVNNFMSGSVNIKINSNLDNKFNLNSYDASKENTFTSIVNFFSTINSLQPNVKTYLYTSTLVNVIFQDFINQLYPVNDTTTSNPLVNLHPSDENWWENIDNNITSYVTDITKQICELQQPILDDDQQKNLQTTLNDIFKGTSSNMQLINAHGNPAGGESVPLIQAPRCSYDSSKNIASLTFVVPYSMYDEGKKNLGQYTLTNILAPMLQDAIVYYNQEQGKNPEPDTTPTDVSYLLYKIGGTPSTHNLPANTIGTLGVDSEIKVDYTDKTNDPNPATKQLPSVQGVSDPVDYIPFIAGVKYTLQITKWSPMLLLYFLNANVTLPNDVKNCNKYIDDTGITINDCSEVITRDQFQNLCNVNMDFGTRKDEYNTPDINQQLLVSQNEKCDCLNSRIAPYNEKNTPDAINANLCFNTGCKDNAKFRTDLINKILGGSDVNVCRQYCDIVYDWLHNGNNMEHANEIDPDLFEKICGTSFTPLRPLFNKNVLISSIIVSVLLIILSGFICKLRNFSLLKSNIIILSLVALFGSASFIFAWEFQAKQN